MGKSIAGGGGYVEASEKYYRYDFVTSDRRRKAGFHREAEQIGDFDGDGIDDLRIRTSAGDLGAQLMRGADTLEWKYYGSVGSEWSTFLAAI